MKDSSNVFMPFPVTVFDGNAGCTQNFMIFHRIPQLLLQSVLLVCPFLNAQDSGSVLFKSGSESARFATVTGSWKGYEYEERKIIRLTPEPIEECRVEMGPVLSASSVSVSAKVLGKQTNRLLPRMGVGVFGKNGFFLRLAPAMQVLELVLYGEVIARAPCEWKSTTWIYIELKVDSPEKDRWVVSGRTWAENAERPEDPTLTREIYREQLTHSLSGRASLTGSPYNGLPIFYDQVVVKKY